MDSSKTSSSGPMKKPMQRVLFTSPKPLRFNSMQEIRNHQLGYEASIPPYMYDKGMIFENPSYNNALYELVPAPVEYGTVYNLGNLNN